MRALRIFLSGCFVLLTPLVQASHESAEKLLGNWTLYAPRFHILQPARTVRQLPPHPDQELVQRVGANAQPLLRDAFAALVVENGELVYEGYANGAGKDKPLEAYSMTKSLTALAVGEALCAGKIRSLDDKATAYVPELEGTAYGAASLRDLLRYTSGAQDPGGNGYSGIHNASDFRAMAQHQMSLLDLLRKYGEASRFKPGEKFIYNGLNSETLSLVVRRATGMPLPAWFEATVWQNAGAEFQAGWFADRDGNGVAEVLFYAVPRDFARLGLYVLDRLTDKAGDACIRDFLKDAAKPHVQKGYWNAAPAFGLGLHVGADGNTWMFGHGGQRVGINIRTGRVLVTNGYRDTRDLDTGVQGVLAR